MAFDMINLSTKLTDGAVADLTRAIKIIRRLNDDKSIIAFSRLSQSMSEWQILVFTDASLGNINKGTGSTGHTLFGLLIMI